MTIDLCLCQVVFVLDGDGSVLIERTFTHPDCPFHGDERTDDR